MKVIITDPCYVLTDEQYETVLDRYEDGDEVDLGEFTCIVYNTWNGDGHFPDTNGNRYWVDSGQLCIVPVDKLSRPIEEGLGHVFDDNDWTNGWYETSEEDGYLTFGDVTIQTGPDPEEDED